LSLYSYRQFWRELLPFVLFGCLFCFDLLWTELRVLWVQQKRSAILFWHCKKCEY
jgi:hypothetical protein